MIDLSKTSGLPISFENDNLILRDEVVSLPVQARKIEEVRDYLQNKGAPTDLKDVYLMYRDVHFKKDEEIFRDNHLRYDITVIFPGLIGNEFAKTIGHYHPVKLGTDMAYPEIYEVLFGTGYFLFQRGIEIYLIKAEQGQKVIVPPGFGHIIINQNSTHLVVANVFADNVNSIYDFFKNNHGAGYYIVKSDDGNINFEKNLNYKNTGDLKIGAPLEIQEFNINFNKPLYASFKENPQSFEFLTSPEKYKNILKVDRLFNFKSSVSL